MLNGLTPSGAEIPLPGASDRALSAESFADAQIEQSFSQAHDWARARLSSLSGERLLDEQALRWIEGAGRTLVAQLAQENRRSDFNALFDWLRQAVPAAPLSAKQLRSAPPLLVPEPPKARAHGAEAGSALAMALSWREDMLALRWRAVSGLQQHEGQWGELLGPFAAEAEALRLGESPRDALEWALRSRQGAQIFSWRAALTQTAGSQSNSTQSAAPAPPQLLASCPPGSLSGLKARMPGAPVGAQLAAALALARHQARLAGTERLRVEVDSLWSALSLECLPGGLVRQQRDAAFSVEELSVSLTAMEALASDPAAAQATIAVPGFCASLLALAPQALMHSHLASRLDMLASRVDPQAWARLALSACALGWLTPLRNAAKQVTPLDRSAQDALLQAALWAASQDLPEAADLLSRWAGVRQPNAPLLALERAEQAGAHRTARSLSGLAQSARRQAKTPAWVRKIAFWRKTFWLPRNH